MEDVEKTTVVEFREYKDFWERIRLVAEYVYGPKRAKVENMDDNKLYIEYEVYK